MQVTFGYVRVSGRGQVDGDGPERQTQAIEKFCSANGLTLAQSFFEAGVSGTVEGIDRPVFTKLLEAIAGCSEPVAIVVERLDRLARDLMVQELLLRECRERGIKVFAVDHGTVEDIASNEGDPTRKLMRQIMGALAEWEKSALVMKLRKARDRKRAETGFCEGARPYGSTFAERTILKLILDLRKVNSSYQQVADQLNLAGYRTRHGSAWTRTAVCKIVRKQQRYSERIQA